MHSWYKQLNTWDTELFVIYFYENNKNNKKHTSSHEDNLMIHDCAVLFYYPIEASKKLIN